MALPDRTSREYTRNWGVAESGAYAAWETGATGKGIAVGVVDTGINRDHPDLGVNISADSTDIVAGRNTLLGPNLHGTRVAGIIAAPLNGTGSVGLAYNSTILSVRADSNDCSAAETTCFRNSDVANAIDYAVEKGARIINLSIGGATSMGPAFEAALQRAVDAGVIFAISAGNQSETNPRWPGRYASDPKFAGNIIVVGAHNSAGDMASFSNQAGVSSQYYLSAPGEGLVGDCSGTACWELSGTSYASPAVAASMALLKEAFPNLNGREIIEILLRSARDGGDTGTDTVWGRGKLDIAQAFQPIGRTTTPSATGAKAVTLDTPMGVYLGGPFGDAMGMTEAMTTIAYDDYDRLFTVNLGNSYRAAPRRSYSPQVAQPMARTQVSTLGPAGTHLSLTAVLPHQEPQPIVARHTFTDAPWQGGETRREALVDVQIDRMSFSAWQGVGGARSPFQTQAGDGFAALAQSDHAVRGTFMLGHGASNHVIISADTGSGDRHMDLQPVQKDASSYARMGVDWRLANGGIAFSFGQLDERMGPLGTYMPIRSDLALPSSTRFTGIGGDVRLSRRVTLTGQAGVGRTDIQGQMLQMSKAAISSNWKVGLQADCRGWTGLCSMLSWEISQPLRIESGTFEATLADVPLDYFDPVTFSRRSFSATPSGREIDFTMRSSHALTDGSQLQWEATAVRQENHRRDAKPGYAFLAVWRKGF